MKTKLKRLIKKIVVNKLPGSYILLFHHVTDTPENKRSGCVLGKEQFEQMINRCAKSCASIDEVLSGITGKVLITFDDGLEDLFTVAYPILRERKIPFVAFIVTEYLDTPGYISTEQLLEMAGDPLVEIGSHGVTHDLLPTLNSKEQQKELSLSKELLQKITGRKIRFFAYSHGQYNNETLKHIDCYEYAMIVRSWPIDLWGLKRWKYLLPRYNVDTTSFENTYLFIDKKIPK